jgi:hypothetical protein
VKRKRAAYGIHGIHGRISGAFDSGREWKGDQSLLGPCILMPAASISVFCNSVFSVCFDACGIYLGLL